MSNRGPAPSLEIGRCFIGLHHEHPTEECFRGTIIVPYVVGVTTTQAFVDGINHRMNKFAVAHLPPKKGVKAAVGSKRKRGADSDGEGDRDSVEIVDEGSTAGYFCQECSGHMNKVPQGKRGKQSQTVVVVRAESLRMLSVEGQPELKPESALMGKDFDGHTIQCVFAAVLSERPAATASWNKRVVSFADHMSFVFTPEDPRVRVMIKIGDKQKRILGGPMEMIEEVNNRMAEPGLKPSILYDADMGAAILPCEQLGIVNLISSDIRAKNLSSEGPVEAIATRIEESDLESRKSIRLVADAHSSNASHSGVITRPVVSESDGAEGHNLQWSESNVQIDDDEEDDEEYSEGGSSDHEDSESDLEAAHHQWPSAAHDMVTTQKVNPLYDGGDGAIRIAFEDDFDDLDNEASPSGSEIFETDEL